MLIGAVFLSAAHADEDVDPTAAGGPCHQYPSSGFRRAVGWGEGRRVKAIREAQAQARQMLLEQTTAGFSEVRRDAVASHIGDAGFHYANRRACAAVDVEQRRLDDFMEDAQQYDQDVTQLAADIAAQVGDGLIQFEQPTWADSGCVASLGPTLSTALRGALGNHPVQLVARGQHNPAATQLRLLLATDSQGVLLSPVLTDPLNGTESPLPGFRFPLDMFNIAENELGTCISDRLLGLDDGARQGGVDIAIEMHTQDGFVCEGASASLELRSQGTVYVQVFSVYGEEALAVFNGTVEGKHIIDSTILRMSDQDERVVVVASAARAEMGAFQDYPQYCRVDGGLSPTMYPLNSSVDSATYTIWPAGSNGCPYRDEIDDMLAQAQQAMDSMPTCP